MIPYEPDAQFFFSSGENLIKVIKFVQIIMQESLVYLNMEEIRNSSHYSQIKDNLHFKC
jgi:hypothetical protein